MDGPHPMHGVGPGLQGVPSLQTVCVHPPYSTTNVFLASLWGLQRSRVLSRLGCLSEVNYSGLAMSVHPCTFSHCCSQVCPSTLCASLPESDFLCLLSSVRAGVPLPPSLPVSSCLSGLVCLYTTSVWGCIWLCPPICQLCLLFTTGPAYCL